MTHRYKVGETVRMASTISLRAPSLQQFKIVRQLPERGGEMQYRIKSAAEQFERVAAESALEKA
ncbi:MAG: hypothetical protein QM651_14075 [Rhodoblastus sp.]